MKETVLVIEDEVLVTLFIQESLRDLGLHAEVHTTGKAALEALQSPKRFTAAIVDLVLPDISGEHIALALLGRIPPLPVVFATGLDASETEKRFGHMGQVRILSKPFDTAELCECLVSLGVIAAERCPTRLMWSDEKTPSDIE